MKLLKDRFFLWMKSFQCLIRFKAKTTSFVMETELYLKAVTKWPESGNHILGSYDENSIIVYQAYNARIAAAIVKNQNLHSPDCIAAGYSMSRMTWIKTNFLWMMYRSGWASKANQECILAFKITREGFENILKLAGTSNGDKKRDQVRLQWDPDHNLDFSKVSTGRRAIQLGLRKEALLKFSTQYIISVTDITDFVIKQSENLTNYQQLHVPIERVFEPKDEETIQNVNLPRMF